MLRSILKSGFVVAKGLSAALYYGEHFGEVPYSHTCTSAFTFLVLSQVRRGHNVSRRLCWLAMQCLVSMCNRQYVLTIDIAER